MARRPVFGYEGEHHKFDFKNTSKMKKKVYASLLTIIFFLPVTDRAQNTIKPDSVPYNSKRLRAVVFTEAALFAGSLYLLNDLWYKDYPRSQFHFFNDNKEWLQMDKIGHATTSCTIGEQGYKSLRWCGVKNNKAVWYGGCLGSVYLMTIEVLDGLSAEWGFSVGDFTANTFGSVVFMGQQFAWNEQRVRFKWSYHKTEFSDYRPDLFGTDLTQTWLKDYNGQTYWLSANIASFLKKNNKFPKWLNVAVGYSAEGMTGANSNPDTNKTGEHLPHFNRYRQFYIAPDVDLTRIKTNSGFLKRVFYALNFVKIPAPALEFSKEKKIRFIPVYF